MIINKPLILLILEDINDLKEERRKNMKMNNHIMTPQETHDAYLRSKGKFIKDISSDASTKGKRQNINSETSDFGGILTPQQAQEMKRQLRASGY
jgi:hypothetical protein